MAYILAILQFVTISLVLFRELKYKSSAVFLWATLELMFAVPHLVDTLAGTTGYDDWVLSRASLFVLGFCATYAVMRFLIYSKRMATNRQFYNADRISHALSIYKKEQKSRVPILLLVLLVTTIIRLYPMVTSAGGLMATSWSAGRDYTASLSYFNSYQWTGVILFSLSGIPVYYWFEGDRLYAVISWMLFLVCVIISRNRIEILPLLCSLIAIVMFKTNRITLGSLLLGVASAVAVIYVVYGLRVFRHYGDFSAFIRMFDFHDFMNRINTYISEENGEMGLRKWFYYFISHNNNFNNFNEGHTYLRMLFVYIPSKWSFGLKPPDFAQSMGAAIGMVAGGSTHPTLFGDCYANMNWLGMYLGFFWALYASAADEITVRYDYRCAVFLYTLNAVVYAIIGRGSVYNGFVNVAYGIPLIIAAFSILGMFSSKRRTHR